MTSMDISQGPNIEEEEKKSENEEDFEIDKEGVLAQAGNLKASSLS